MNAQEIAIEVPSQGARRATGEGSQNGWQKPERFSARQKTAVVLRLLRGEALDLLSRGNRSGCEHLTLAIISPHGLPWRHGNTACLLPRGVGTDPTRSARLSSGTRSACGALRRPEAGVASTAEPDRAALLPLTSTRPAPPRAATPSSAYTLSWWSPGPSWPYPHPCSWGRSRGGGGEQTRTVDALPGALIGRGSHAVAASRQRDAAHPAGGDRVSMASVGGRRLRRGGARALARGGAQGDLWSSGTGTRGAGSRVVALVQAHAAPGEGGGGRWAEACGPAQPLGAGHDRGARGARRGSPHGRASARGGPPRCDQVASGRHARGVLGGGDEPGDGVGGTAGTRGARGSRAVGRGVLRPRGHGALQSVPLVPRARASAGLGAGAEGWCREARPWRARRGER
jgi:hypothetical protein